MVRVSLRDFLVTGLFGPLAFGMGDGEVAALLGEPDARGGMSRRQRWAPIWKYGAIELHFGRHARTLEMIFAGHFDLLAGGGGLDVDPWILSGALRLDAALPELERAGIAHAVAPYAPDPECHEIRSAGGVILLFGKSHDCVDDERRLVALWRRVLASGSP